MSSPDSKDDEEATVSSSPRPSSLEEGEVKTAPSPIGVEIPYDFESSYRIGMQHIRRGLEIASSAIEEIHQAKACGRGRKDSVNVVANLTRLIQSVREDYARLNEMVAGESSDLDVDRYFDDIDGDLDDDDTGVDRDDEKPGGDRDVDAPRANRDGDAPGGSPPC
ncbi:hypothetical protein HPP92_025779 [Vanilla planifolia]|uniref:Uncharacterized protein n=1 Tax=Vanilla planifolia TaxID=51239 RepID=A0A835U9N8_VANPL|nr:hypothetical protein HPP92_025779 [Vanilla planifolia]